MYAIRAMTGWQKHALIIRLIERNVWLQWLFDALKS